MFTSKDGPWCVLELFPLRLCVEGSHEGVDILVVVGNQGGVGILKQRYAEQSHVPIVAWECRAQPVTCSTGAA